MMDDGDGGERIDVEELRMAKTPTSFNQVSRHVNKDKCLQANTQGFLKRGIKRELRSNTRLITWDWMN
jgi:hypothetical protein